MKSYQFQWKLWTIVLFKRFAIFNPIDCFVEEFCVSLLMALSQLKVKVLLVDLLLVSQLQF